MQKKKKKKKNVAGAFLGNCMPTLMIFGMWVGLGPKVRMLEFWAWHMLVPWDCWGQKC